MARLLTFARRARHQAASERGAGIITALVVGLIVLTLGITWSQIGVHHMQSSAHERGREQAVNVAEAGVNDAMSELTLDASFAGMQSSIGGEGDFDVDVSPMSTDPTDMRRLITSTGYSPDRNDPRAVVRRYEAEVELETTDGFDFALFAGAGVLDGDNHMTVNGDVYGKDGVTLDNNTDVLGDVVSPAWVVTKNNTLVTGDVYSGGDVTLENSQTTIQGSVFSGGNVYVNAKVRGDVQAAGSVTLGPFGQVDGNIAEQSPPPPVRQEYLPTFQWDAANYSPAPTTWSSATAFRDEWFAHASTGQAFSGHHRITDTGTIVLDRKWSMGGDVTIVADGKVDLRRSITNATSETVDLVIVSFSEDGIELSNEMTLPDSIRVLLFAPNGPVDFNNLKHFTGAVYAESVLVDQNFTLTWMLPDVPGFSWTESSDVHYRVVLRVLREMSALVPDS